MTLLFTTLGLLLVAVFNAIIEMVVAIVYGLRKRGEIIAVLGINMITNPAMNFLLLFERYITGERSNYFILFLLEVLVVIIEWKLLVHVLGGDSRRMFFLALLMNLVSLGIGLFIFIAL